MYLAIKTDSNTSELILVNPDGTEVNRLVWESGRELADRLLDKIGELMAQAKAEWTDIKGVTVFKGPGSFTGLRIGATIANTIAYSQGYPIVGAMGDNWVSHGCHRLQHGESDTQVVPFYGADPNITRPGRG